MGPMGTFGGTAPHYKDRRWIPSAAGYDPSHIPAPQRCDCSETTGSACGARLGASDRHGGRRPGDTDALERRMIRMTRNNVGNLRRRWYRNLHTLAVTSGVMDRLPERLAEEVLRA